MIDQTWTDVKDAAPLFGMTHEGIKNAISMGRFPCPTYKLGRRRVIDNEVLEAFFKDQRAKGLQTLKDRPASVRAKKARA